MKKFFSSYVFIFLCVFCASPAFADLNLISPGPLSNPHASLDKSSECSKCHAAGKGVSPTLCLDCHKEIKATLDAKRGFHGRMNDVLEKCSKCHPDHAGREFEMIEWTPSKEKFDHSQTGYPLRGKHDGVTCNKCHKPSFVTDPSIRALSKTKKETFLGLSQNCSTCHFDEHRGQLSTKCQSCHNEQDWKKTTSFNHNKTDFPLRGRHTEIECSSCHQSLTDKKSYVGKILQPLHSTYSKFKKIPHLSCENCHEDVHKGKFGKKCQSCHNETTWKQIGGIKIEGRDFHQKTRFPLRGAHAAVQCQSCHGPWGKEKVKYKDLEFQKCTNCHADAHSGQISKEKLECNNCHTEESFSVINYTLQDHDKTRYPLEGAHTAIACKQCHVDDQSLSKNISSKVLKILEIQGRKPNISLSRFIFKNDLNQCETCHADIHKGQFEKKKCSDCHVVTSFMKLKFNHNLNSRYALKGKHQEVACYKCHPTVKTANGAEMEVYKPLSMDCIDCHTDIHVGQFRRKGEDKIHCERCHTEIGWKQLLFDHNNKKFTSYKLEGKHIKVECDKCHKPVNVTPKLTIKLYKPLPTDCFGCHADYHQGEFKDFVP
jgi:hypothetical protein